MNETGDRPPSHVGRKWNSRDGEREVLSIMTTPDGSDRLVVSNPGSSFVDIIPPASLENMIRVEESWAALTRKAREAHENHEAEQAAAKAARYDLRGFTDGMSDVVKHRAVSVLSKQTRHNGGPVTTRRELIEDLVGKGWTVKIHRGERQFTSPTDSYLKEQAITKIGMDYAQHLQGRMHEPETGGQREESSQKSRRRPFRPGR